MQAEYWRQRWLDNAIGWHQESFNRHLERYWSQLELATGSQVLVPLCGKSKDMLWLAGQGHRVLGVELSDKAAADFFGENHLSYKTHDRLPFQHWESDEVEILVGDFFDMKREDTREVAAVFDRASLVALPPEMRRDYVAHLRAILPQGTPILLVSLDYDQSVRQGPPFAVSEAEVRELWEPSHTVELIASVDLLAEEERYRAEGHSRFNEEVFLLTAR